MHRTVIGKECVSTVDFNPDRLRKSAKSRTGSHRKRSRLRPSCSPLEERSLMSTGFVMPPAYVEPSPTPTAYVEPPAYVDPYPTIQLASNPDIYNYPPPYNSDPNPI